MEDEFVVSDAFRVLESTDASTESPGNDDTWAYFGVYDGHGGRGAVEACRDRLHVAVGSQLRGLARFDCKSVHSALSASFKQVDAELAQKNGGWRSGCTATTALAHRIHGEVTLYVANVGDSRAVILGDGDAKRVTIDHRACDPGEARRVEREGAVVRNGRVAGALAVSRSLGDHYLKPGVSCEPDICTYHVAGARVLVIASDGLWDFVDDDEVQEVVEELVDLVSASSEDPSVVARHLREDAASALVTRAKDRGSRDNITVLVVFFSS